MKRRQLVFLACPYTHPDKNVRDARFRWANRAALYLIHQEFAVYSPISMCHPIEDQGLTKNTQYEFWQDHNEAILALADIVAILELAGWQRSRGVVAETATAKDLKKKIIRLSPVTVWNGLVRIRGHATAEDTLSDAAMIETEVSS